MKKIFIMIAWMLALSSLAACQATPEKPAVVQKDMEQMIKKAEATPMITDTPGITLAQSLGVPERFQTTINKDNLTIKCDIDMELPNATKLPMVRVKAGKFSQEQVYAMFKALCGDIPMYISPELEDKAYYEQELISDQAELAKQTDKDSIRFYKEIISEDKKQYAKAPNTLEITPSDGTLKVHKFDESEGGLAGTNTILNATSDVHNLEDPMTFYVQNDADYTHTTVKSYKDEFGNTQFVAPESGSWFEFSREGQKGDQTYSVMYQQGTKLADVTALSLSGGKVANSLLSMTPQQARDIVEKFLTKAKINDMKIDTVSLYSSKRELPPEIAQLYINRNGGVAPTEAPESQAYILRLLRQVSGVKTESAPGYSQVSSEGQTDGPEWYYEEMTATVDDKGIANVYWMAPLEITDVLTENTAIRPWNDIANIFEKMMVVSSDIYTIPDRKQEIDITHASLSLERIIEKDSYTTGLLVPVWNFYGTVTTWNNNGEKRTVSKGYMPLLSVNAIDGTVINTQQGY